MNREKPSEIVSYINRDRKKIKDRLSRYSRLKVLVNEDGQEYLETLEKPKIRESSKDSFYSVESGYENRLDLISYKFYGTPFLWWAIALVNNIVDPLDVGVGVVLRIPEISSIYSSGVIKA
jgi:nucleoid-associated protein YgaU